MGQLDNIVGADDFRAIKWHLDDKKILQIWPTLKLILGLMRFGLLETVKLCHIDCQGVWNLSMCSVLLPRFSLISQFLETLKNKKEVKEADKVYVIKQRKCWALIVFNSVSGFTLFACLSGGKLCLLSASSSVQTRVQGPICMDRGPVCIAYLAIEQRVKRKILVRSAEKIRCRVSGLRREIFVVISGVTKLPKNMQWIGAAIWTLRILRYFIR